MDARWWLWPVLGCSTPSACKWRMTLRPSSWIRDNTSIDSNDSNGPLGDSQIFLATPFDNLWEVALSWNLVGSLYAYIIAVNNAAGSGPAFGTLTSLFNGDNAAAAATPRLATAGPTWPPACSCLRTAPAKHADQ